MTPATALPLVEDDALMALADIQEITDDAPASTLLVRVEQVSTGQQIISLMTWANSLLAKARSAPDFKDVITLGKMAQVVVRQKRLGAEAHQHARDIVLVASRRLGDFLKRTNLAVGGRPS